MKAIPSDQKAQVISLLQDKISLRQIAEKTHLGKSTVWRIKQELDDDKENLKGGRPTKLSTRHKSLIICQITTGKLDNAVQATNFINPTLSQPVTPQTV
ncbi:hypothetical protein NP233_g8679 [Leucocoprinus birnbaumii]|uniref:Resolvase HTH domain-containing protein n=1 Tax=Leucocoprinus birnbaumii TaxID=56174 RepID=A0AAD5YNU9_9AGAR|nr:hypothetical protein NP233_g8679 [Leucocoprinus birnbaumii]